jgi:hypothetical protein
MGRCKNFGNRRSVSSISRVGLAALAAVAACGSFALAAQDTTRSITPEQFLKARPASRTQKPPSAATYRPVGPRRPATKLPAGSETVELGVTIWRLRAAKPGDAARLLVQEADVSTQWTPERVPAGTPLTAGDRVRLSIESPRSGYLYVVDREQYADGTESDPFLIFPTRRTRGGENRVAGGRLVEIPSQDDRPPFFTMRPSRPDQTGERLTIVVTEQPLTTVTVAAEATKLPREMVSDWETRGAVAVEHLEMVGGAGRAWSAAEQRAGANPTRLLRQDEPPPQTLFRVVVSRPDLIAVNIVLTHRKNQGKGPSGNK